jgi:trimethylamine--corrinoid protein Co-methyltransferase
MGMVTSQVQAEDCIKMCQFAFGEDFVNDNPVMVSLFNCTSPLTWDTTMLDAMRIYARHNQIIILSPFPMTGASAPITVAGSVVQIIAEALAGIAYVQLIRPGCPCLFGISTLITSMKTGGVLYGSAEANHISCIGSKIVRGLGIPIRMNGFKNNAMDSDIEAGYQSMQTFMMPALSGGNYFTHCAGWIESALSTCYVKFITDLEQITIMQRLLAGFEMSEDAMALNAIEEVGPGGNYIGCSHTLGRFRSAFYEPELQTTFTYEQWSEEGKPPVAERALALLSQKLEEYEDPGIDPGLDEVLKDFVRRRHEELPDSMD